MGLFFYTQKGSIISTVVLPTTEIIEPFFIRFWYLDTKKESNEMLPFIHLSNKLIQRSSSMGKRVVYRHEFQLRYLRMLIQGNQPFLQLSLGYHLHRHKS